MKKMDLFLLNLNAHTRIQKNKFDEQCQYDNWNQNAVSKNSHQAIHDIGRYICHLGTYTGIHKRWYVSRRGEMCKLIDISADTDTTLHKSEVNAKSKEHKSDED